MCVWIGCCVTKCPFIPDRILTTGWQILLRSRLVNQWTNWCYRNVGEGLLIRNWAMKWQLHLWKTHLSMINDSWSSIPRAPPTMCGQLCWRVSFSRSCYSFYNLKEGNHWVLEVFGGFGTFQGLSYFHREKTFELEGKSYTMSFVSLKFWQRTIVL